MDNRRVFSRRPCKLVAYFSDDIESCLGEVRDVSLGGLLARVNSDGFSPGQWIRVKPEDQSALEYSVSWVQAEGGGFEMGLRFAHSVSIFWNSWAADLLAGVRPTLSEVLERRHQVRLDCLLEGTLHCQGESRIVDILDIGGGGALIELDESLGDDLSFLELTIETPVRVGKVRCQIARAWPGTPALYGLEFVDLKQRHRLALLRLLDLLFRQS